MADQSSASSASASAGMAAASAHPPRQTGVGFPGDDGGRTLAEIAHRDLDAALQLLAERAQYITGANGAAIALRRGEHNDMLCRASAGSNAPELGALLSMEYGLSGESARTRQTMRCDDAEHDPRVNREGCRRLGIASVVVMPVVRDAQVLGVFELFSGQPRAFAERDICALRRLSEMVETAVRHAVAAQVVLPVEKAAGAELPPEPHAVVAEAAEVESDFRLPEVDSASSLVNEPTAKQPALKQPALNQFSMNQFSPKELSAEELPASELAPPEPVTKGLEKAEMETAKSEPAPKKPRFWSAASHAAASEAHGAQGGESIAVPAVLRNLQKCQACGFPVSQGRRLCVECEEKQWRGQRLPRPVAAAGHKPDPGSEPQAVAIPGKAPQISVAKGLPLPPLAAQTSGAFADSRIKSAADRAIVASPTADLRPQVALDVSADAPAWGNSAPFLSSAMPAESWFASNKYILGALIVVALVIAGMVWLR